MFVHDDAAYTVTGWDTSVQLSQVIGHQIISGTQAGNRVCLKWFSKRKKKVRNGHFLYLLINADCEPGTIKYGLRGNYTVYLRCY